MAAITKLICKARGGDQQAPERMFATGILDPTKVTHTALQNAASIAALMVTTEALVAEAPQKDESHGGRMGGMDFQGPPLSCTD